MPSQEFIQRMQERLIEEKERITDELSQLSEHTELGSGATDTVDYDAGVQEVGLDEVNQDIRAQLKEDLVKIEEALQRIEAGTYGKAADGKDIDEARLEILPWADTNVE